MDTIGMDSYPFIAAAAAAVIVVPEQDRVLLVGRRKGNPRDRGLEISGDIIPTANGCHDHLLRRNGWQ